MDDPKPDGHWTNHLSRDSAHHAFLRQGVRYRVATEFIDFDGDLHGVGEGWTFRGHSFLPYDDGLCLIVSLAGDDEWLVRLQDRPRAQGEIVRRLHDYLEPA